MKERFHFMSYHDTKRFSQVNVFFSVCVCGVHGFPFAPHRWNFRAVVFPTAPLVRDYSCYSLFAHSFTLPALTPKDIHSLNCLYAWKCPR